MTIELKSGNKIVLSIGEVEEQKGDAILNWTSLDLDAGPDSFYKIHRKAGPQVASAANVLRGHLQSSTAVSTIAGFLDFYIVIHSILPLPDEDKNFTLTWYNIINTIEEYQRRGNICRNLYCTLPFINKNLLNSLLDYESQLENFTFYFMFQKEEDLIRVSEILKPSFRKKVKTFWSKIFK